MSSAVSQAAVPASLVAESDSSKQSRTIAFVADVVQVVAGGRFAVAVKPLSGCGEQPMGGPEEVEEPPPPLVLLVPVTELLLVTLVPVPELELVVVVQYPCPVIWLSADVQPAPPVVTADVHEETALAGSVAQHVASVSQSGFTVVDVLLLLPPEDLVELVPPVPPVLLELHAAPVMAAANKTGMAKRCRLRFMAGHLTLRNDRVKEIGDNPMTKER